MNSKSSNERDRRTLVIARVTGRRGTAGEFTARVPSGNAERWTGVTRVLVRFEDGEMGEHVVERSRAYRDRLVIKLAGVDDVEHAERFRGADLVVELADAPALPDGEYWLDDLVGRTVIDENDAELGTVADITETGAGAVLVVAGGEARRDEILIPLVRVFVKGIEEDTGRLRVQIPDDLRDLNRGGSA